VSALYGSSGKGAGVLNNELYVGRYVWNARSGSRIPIPEDASGSFARKVNRSPPRGRSCASSMTSCGKPCVSAWHRRVAPHCRRGRGGVPTTLLGGIMRCGYCGGAEDQCTNVPMRRAQRPRSCSLRQHGPSYACRLTRKPASSRIKHGSGAADGYSMP